MLAGFVFTHKYHTELLSWFTRCFDIVQSDGKRRLSALPNKGLRE